MKTALIIGATSSLGVALCEQLAEEGTNLFLVARDEETLVSLTKNLSIRYEVDIQTWVCDLSSSTRIDATLAEVLSKRPTIECCFMLAGAMENKNQPIVERVKTVVDSTYRGPIIMLELIAEAMKKQQQGTIAVISSVAGDRGRQSNYLYGSAKAGLSVFADGLRHALSTHGIHVMTVKPGFIDTPLTYGLESPLICSREKAAKSILKAVENKKNTIYVPFFWRWIMLVIQHIPEFIFKRMKL